MNNYRLYADVYVGTTENHTKSEVAFDFQAKDDKTAKSLVLDVNKLAGLVCTECNPVVNGEEQFAIFY